MKSCLLGLDECESRMDFNDEFGRYLPENFKGLLEQPPTKYEIFPKFLRLEEIHGSILAELPDDLGKDGMKHFLIQADREKTFGQETTSDESKIENPFIDTSSFAVKADDKKSHDSLFISFALDPAQKQ